MATKKTEKSESKSTKAPAAKATPKAAPKKAKAEAKPAAPRHPKARVVAKHGSKEALAKIVAEALVREDEDPTSLAASLKTASNQQLLRLARVASDVKSKFGTRAKMIAAIGTAEKKSKDKDFLAKLDSLSLPHLFDLAVAAERRAKA